MKIAGLTWWRNNYGSILQAYALQTTLNEYDNISYEILNQYGKKIASFDNLLNKLKTVGVKKTIKRLVWRFGLKRLRVRVQNMQSFIDEYLHVSEQVYSEDTIKDANRIYDGFICGSDQIWNPVFSSLDSMYWLTFVEQGKRKIAYAPSIGSQEIELKDAELIRKNLESFDYLSCREKSGVNLINDIMKKNICRNVVDPTLLLTREEWDGLCAPRICENKYIFVYMLRGNKKQRQLIEKFAAEVKVPIVTIPFLDNEKVELYDWKFGDIKIWDAAPTDFISLIKHAEYVFADSFHCMVFSSIYHRPFFVFPKIGSEKREEIAQISRMRDFQDMLGMNNRIIKENITINELIGYEEIDWNNVDKVIYENRLNSLEYLEHALRNG